MHIVVCMKQVPRDNSVKINPDLSINADGIEKIMNLFDEYAVEEGIAWNERHGGKLTVLSLGTEEWVEQMRRALAMGATDALLLSDPAFATLDPLAAAKVVAAAIRKLGDVDLIFCGRNSTDDESGAFAPALARSLGWPQLTYVGKVLELDPATKQIRVERHLEAEVETVSAPLPAVVSVIKDINEPRYPALLKIRKVARVEPPVWSAADLGLSDLAPAATLTNRVPPPARPKGELISGPDAASKVKTLVDKLLESQVL
ncbi:MAG: electron transfer flavoprotein subunit beta/FixA family protein [Chloroflexi bacterium OHK40]